MRLLVTNDDGLDSVFLHELVRALRAAGHSSAVVAPAVEQSWIGSAKSRQRPVRAQAADRGLGCPTWMVDGTPADCVNIALAHLLPGEGVEGVVSGINLGRNTSLAFIPASGTIGGAWEGALHGLPAAALSLDLPPPAYEKIKHGEAPGAEVLAALRSAAAQAAGYVPAQLAALPPRSFTVHSLNYPCPCPPDTPVCRTVPARLLLPRLFAPADAAGLHRFVYRQGEDCSPAEPLTDNAALAAGAISHTVLDYTRLGHT